METDDMDQMPCADERDLYDQYWMDESRCRPFLPPSYRPCLSIPPGFGTRAARCCLFSISTQTLRLTVIILYV